MDYDNVLHPVSLWLEFVFGVSRFSIVNCIACGKYNHIFIRSHTPTPLMPCSSPHSRASVWVSHTHINWNTEVWSTKKDNRTYKWAHKLPSLSFMGLKAIVLKINRKKRVFPHSVSRECVCWGFFRSAFFYVSLLILILWWCVCVCVSCLLRHDTITFLLLFPSPFFHSLSVCLSFPQLGN